MTAAAQIPEIETHEPHWASRSAFQLIVFALLFTEIALGFAVFQGWIWASIALVLLASHFMHGLLIGFHEASHGMLRQNKTFNEFDGVLIGILSLTSFTLYRVAHQTHHMHLATPRDEELWPFVRTEIPRWKRCLAAFLELNFGLFYTPSIFLRTFLRKDSPIRNTKVRSRIWREIWGTLAVWATILGIVAVFRIWSYFVWLFLIPAWVSGNLQSWRKYIEHVGMTGDTPNSATRSIVNDTWTGKLMAWTLLHEPFHGVHHRHPGLPHPELPQHAEKLKPETPVDIPPFPNYSSAFFHLFRCLTDPRVGPQWSSSPAS